MTAADRALLARVYEAFNARDVDAVLAAMHPDVAWPNGMEGGCVHGHAAVREYWMGQWAIIDPRVDPMRIEPDGAGGVVVTVHQVVRDLAGAVKADRVVQHVYRIRDGLIATMEIRTPPA